MNNLLDNLASGHLNKMKLSIKDFHRIPIVRNMAINFVGRVYFGNIAGIMHEEVSMI
jgi:hypothetical protein